MKSQKGRAKVSKSKVNVKVKSTLKHQLDKENIGQGRSYSSIMVKSGESLKPRKTSTTPTMRTG